MDNWQNKIASPKISGIVFTPEDEAPCVIMLVAGEDAQGQPQWAYAKIPAQHYAAFKEAETQGNYSLQNFGEILRSGAGKAPPESVLKEMQEKYDCDENFEDSLTAMIEEAITAWNEAMDEKDNP